MIKNLNKYLTSFQAAKKLGFSPDYIRLLIKQGKIKAEKLGQNWLIENRQIRNITRQRKPKNKKG